MFGKVTNSSSVILSLRHILLRRKQKTALESRRILKLKKI